MYFGELITTMWLFMAALRPTDFLLSIGSEFILIRSIYYEKVSALGGRVYQAIYDALP
ncbi:hypothetical protein NBRC116585_02960 [Thalassolituus maritimus]|uniref:ABC transmembrane type-1 domain-containing protein n=1 Tax=Thalassolituus maritimus TaxID=484498 RepID=A0ABP9ZVR7_9GAMM